MSREDIDNSVHEITRNPITGVVSKEAIENVKELQGQLQKAISLQQKLNQELTTYNGLLFEKKQLEQI